MQPLASSLSNRIMVQLIQSRPQMATTVPHKRLLTLRHRVLTCALLATLRARKILLLLSATMGKVGNHPSLPRNTDGNVTLCLNSLSQSVIETWYMLPSYSLNASQSTRKPVMSSILVSILFFEHFWIQVTFHIYLSDHFQNRDMDITVSSSQYFYR